MPRNTLRKETQQVKRLVIPKKNEWDLIQKIITHLEEKDKAIIHAIYERKNTVTQQVWGIIRFRSQNYWVQRDELYNILELLENNYHKEVELRHRRRQIYIRNENHLMVFPQLENELPF